MSEYIEFDLATHESAMTRPPLGNTIVYSPEDYAGVVGEGNSRESELGYYGDVIYGQQEIFRRTVDGQTILRRRTEVARLLDKIDGKLSWRGLDESDGIWLTANGLSHAFLGDQGYWGHRLRGSLLDAERDLLGLELKLIQRPNIRIGSTVLLPSEGETEYRGKVRGILGDASLLVTCNSDNQRPLHMVRIDSLIEANQGAMARTISPSSAEYPGAL